MSQYSAATGTTGDLEKMPSGGKVNKPASGTYGEGAANDRLAAALPLGDMKPSPEATPQPPQSQPVVPRSRTGRASGPPIPAPLLAPTNRPNVPIDTPLDRGQGAPMSAQQQRLLLLERLIHDPRTSETTKEWALLYRRQLIGG